MCDCSLAEGNSDACVLRFASHSLEQALKKLSAQELCLLMKELNLICCARAFGEEDLDGEGLLELSKEDFTSMLQEIGVRS